MDSWITIGVGVLTAVSTLLGVVLLWGLARIDKWLDRPKLKIEFGQGKDFVSLNPTYDEKQFPVSETFYVRVKVTNVKFPTAKNCSGYLTALERWDGKQFEETGYNDVLRLVWSHNPGRPFMHVMYKTPHWLDVVHTDRDRHGLFLDTEVKPYRYINGFDIPGVYRLTVQVSAEQTEPAKVSFYLLWSGVWNHFQVFDENEFRSRHTESTKTQASHALVKAN
jgi:hypothetical protein